MAVKVVKDNWKSIYSPNGKERFNCERHHLLTI
jgi:hypothetical protein